MKAIRVEQQGPPEVLVLEEVDDPRPGPGQALVGLHAAGVNMIDVQQRSGGYQVAVPFTPGTEGAGEVLEVGADVEGWTPGDRVAYASVPGAYAELAIVPAARLVPVPAEVPTDLAAAVLLQGMTAHYLLHSIVPLRGGEVVVVQAAAGGVGLLLTQMATAAGVHVIGTTSTDEKAALVQKAGRRCRGSRPPRPRRGRRETDRRRGRTDRLRFRGTRHLRREPRSTGPARMPGLVRPVERPGPLVRPLEAPEGRFGLRHPARSRPLRGDPGRAPPPRGCRDDDGRERRPRRADPPSAFPLARADEAHRLLQSGTTAGKLLLVMKEEP